MMIVWNFLQEDTAEISDKCDSPAILGSWKVWGMPFTIFDVSSFEIGHSFPIVRSDSIS
jgi:hypothetical protein